MTKIFNLTQGGKVLGILRAYESNFPWLNCKFESTKAFEEISLLFENELAILESDDISAWEEAYNQVADLNLKLIDTEEGKSIENILLHIEGEEAWFRF